MRAAVLRVRRSDVEAALDALLPLVPAGVRAVSRDDAIDLVAVEDGGALPEGQVLSDALGDLLLALRIDEVPADPRERRAHFWTAVTVAGRVRLRPDWAPAPEPDPALVDLTIVAADGAFGTGAHPTTLMCLELLLDLAGAGSFADLGCGSGVLAACASRLGHAPVVAVDHAAASVAAAGQTAALSGAVVQARAWDLLAQAPPPAVAAAANVPPAVHEAVARGLAPELRSIILSGFLLDDADAVLGAYVEAGFEVERVLESGGWVASLLRRPS